METVGEQVLPSATTTAPTAGDPTASPPPLINVSDPVIDDLHDVVAESEIHALISDEEHDLDHEPDLDHDFDHENEHEHPDEGQEQDHVAETVTVVSLDDLKLKIIKQVEYYFSDENLPNDKYMLSLVKRNKEGFVPIPVIASFRKMKKLTRDHLLIAAALKESSLLVVSGDGKRVKRLNPLRFNEVKDHKLYTVLVENLPEDHSRENIRQIFQKAGNIKKITINDPNSTAASAKHIKVDKFFGSKLHALVEYETTEAAETAVAMLNNEQDWRNGMRVKLLSRMGKYVHNKQAWKGSNSEKNSSSHASEKNSSSHVSEKNSSGHVSEKNSSGHVSEKNSSSHVSEKNSSSHVSEKNSSSHVTEKSSSHASEKTGDEENHGSHEHHEGTPEEKDREHLSKDKGGQRNTKQGRSRKHKYRATNGMGHGGPSSFHATEPSKPPPGPKMPDGTRGFAIGRGRPPVPASN
ncbi:la-related protein 6A [Trifolium pratense]|uniref:la-related protein 6A n=1 Tax=Trifolium pratense TaxID=57577 RepID=UPI001E695E29|nr:la-related protein 6A [Trifolium pratense]